MAFVVGAPVQDLIGFTLSERRRVEGPVVQLARTSHLQCEGHRFKSGRVHRVKLGFTSLRGSRVRLDTSFYIKENQKLKIVVL